MIYDVGNPGLGLLQAQKFGRDLYPHPLIIGSPMTKQIYLSENSIKSGGHNIDEKLLKVTANTNDSC
jgi:hypothetical protein